MARLACAGLLSLLAALPAQAALFGDDEARKAIIDLRAKVDANRQNTDATLSELRRQQEEQGANTRRAVLDIANQVEALRAELAQLRGQNEQLARDVTELSIGQQQRVAAARALLGRPAIIVADEPTSALDHDSRESFLQLLMDECRDQGATLLFVSHDTSLGALFDRVVSLQDINRAVARAA